MKKLFSWPYDDTEPDEVARVYFDRMYSDDDFLEMLQCVALEKVGLSAEGAYCFFPDWSSPDPTDHFEGVEIRVGYPTTDDIIVSEETFFRWLRIACDKYVALHPEEKQKVEELLAKAPM